jgi:hypothetical protein
VPNIFDRLSQHRSAAPPEEKPQPNNKSAQLLLNWLNRRPETTITQRQIRNHGPRPTRDKGTAIHSAEILVAQGYLTPINSYTWKFNRQPLTPQS